MKRVIKKVMLALLFLGGLSMAACTFNADADEVESAPADGGRSVYNESFIHGD